MSWLVDILYCPIYFTCLILDNSLRLTQIRLKSLVTVVLYCRFISIDISDSPIPVTQTSVLIRYKPIGLFQKLLPLSYNFVCVS